MPLYRFVIHSVNKPDPRAAMLMQGAKELGFKSITALECDDLYLVQGEVSITEQSRLITALFCDSISQVCRADTPIHPPAYSVERVLLAGITDPIARQIHQAAQKLSIHSIEQIAVGHRFIIHTLQGLTLSELQHFIRRLLINPVIHKAVLGRLTELHRLPHTHETKRLVNKASTNTKPDADQLVNAQYINSTPMTLPQALRSSINLESWNIPNIATAQSIAIRHLTPVQLEALSHKRQAALDLIEMQTIQAYYQAQQREPSDIEFETIAQTWSEHCSHKTFRAIINYNGQIINGLLNSYIQAATEAIQAPWVVSAFVDNAGIIAFDDDYQLAFKVETHNHPSAIEPFSGANTGLGGVIRDILGVSAKPIAATDVFALGPQDLSTEQLPIGGIHPRLIRTGVVAGVQDYGNKTGIPTVNGAIFYDPGYTANPLVFCGCVGLLSKDRHPRQPQVGDRILVLGNRTGRDGLRGATFSSMTMVTESIEVASAVVPVGNPIIAKGLIEVIDQARDQRLYHAITDCGAGGLSSAIGEMASDLGAEIELDYLPLNTSELLAWEIWLSETQERMVLAVPPLHVVSLRTLCTQNAIESADLGVFTGNRQLVVSHQGNMVLQLDTRFLYQGRPQKHFILSTTTRPIAPQVKHAPPTYSPIQLEGYLLQLLRHPNISSKEAIIRLYDHEVQGGTVIKPLIGAQNDGPSDACVLKPQGTRGQRGIVLANGFNPEFGKYDPYCMAISAIDEAIRNAVAVGADPDRIALLDNFCWGDPKCPETLAALVECVRGCHVAALHYATPFISGKDSLNNEYHDRNGQRHAIPGALLISAIGIIENINTALSLDLKTPGNHLYLFGETHAHFGGSHFNLCTQTMQSTDVPNLPTAAPQIYRCLHQAIQQCLVRACHDLSEGGLAVALAEMCLAGRLGCAIELATDDIITCLFSESNGRLLLEIAPTCQHPFEALVAEKGLKQWLTPLGRVSDQTQLQICNNHGHSLINLSMSELLNAWQTQPRAL